MLILLVEVLHRLEPLNQVSHGHVRRGQLIDQDKTLVGLELCWLWLSCVRHWSAPSVLTVPVAKRPTTAVVAVQELSTCA